MKRIISVILTLAMALALCGCSGTSADTASETAAGLTSESTSTPKTWEEKYLAAAKLFYQDMSYNAAFELLEGAEDSDYAPALRLLGECYYGAYGTGYDYEKAFELYTRAAEMGDILAIVSLADTYFNGLIEHVDEDKYEELSAQFFERALTAEDDGDPAYPDIITELGWSYWYGQSIEADEDKAAECFQKAIELGYVKAYVYWGLCYNDNMEYTKALELFSQAAELGSSHALYNLGEMYCYGNGVEQDYAMAMDYYTAAAEKEDISEGKVNAMWKIGLMYKYGWGVGQDYAQATEWFQMAADAGLWDAESALASAESDADKAATIAEDYVNSYGIDNKLEKALEWYSKAAKLGHATAYSSVFNLAIKYYEDGDYESANLCYESAAELCKIAADAGDKDAMNILGILYETGQGVLIDTEAAVEWFAKAMESGSTNAMLNIVNYYFCEVLGQDYDTVRELRIKWVEDGYDTAYVMRILGDMYMNGEGVRKDEAKAQEWYAKADAIENPQDEEGMPLTSMSLLETTNEKGTKMIDVLIGEFTDIFGNTYESAIQLWVIKAEGWANEEHAVYELLDPAATTLVNPYKTLKGKLACGENSNSGSEMTITFELDDVIVGSYYISAYDTEPVEYEIDVTGGDVLVITCSTEVGVHGYGLVTGELYK